MRKHDNKKKTLKFNAQAFLPRNDTCSFIFKQKKKDFHDHYNFNASHYYPVHKTVVGTDS